CEPQIHLRRPARNASRGAHAASGIGRDHGPQATAAMPRRTAPPGWTAMAGGDLSSFPFYRQPARSRPASCRGAMSEIPRLGVCRALSDERRLACSEQERSDPMRFVLLYKSGKPETSEPPSPSEMEKVGKLVQEMAHAGVLLGTEGFEPSAK